MWTCRLWGIIPFVADGKSKQICGAFGANGFAIYPGDNPILFHVFLAKPEPMSEPELCLLKTNSSFFIFN